MKRRVAVIGGGISGLTAAYRILQTPDARDVEVVLYESADRLGGVINTDVSQGVVLEGGPDSFLRRKPEATALIRELHLDDQLMGTNPHVRGSYIFHRGHFHDIPQGVRAGIPTRFDTLWGTELLALGEKLRLWGDVILPRGPVLPDQSLGLLLRYRFGDGYVDRIAAPMLAGIYAGDIDKLSTAVTAPQLLTYQLRGRSLIREAGATAVSMGNASTAGSPSSMFVSLVGGVSSLIEALTEAMRGRITLNLSTAVASVSGGPKGYEVKAKEGSSLEVSDVIVAVPAYQAAQLLTFLDDETRRLLSSIPYADLAVVGAVYSAAAFPRPLTRTGFLVPRGEGLQMTAGTWVRAKWDYPDHTDLIPIRGFFGQAGQRALLNQSDEQLLSIFREEVGFILGVTDLPQYARVFRVPQGMPQYLVGHQDRVQRIRAAQTRWPGLQLIGAYFDGVGVPDCIRHANQAASELAESWSKQPMSPR